MSARDKLSANLQALSYAMGQAQQSEQALQIPVQGVRYGARDIRSLNPTEGRGTEAEHRPNLQRGRDETGEGRIPTFLRNVMQYLGSQAGVQTKRMREDYQLLQDEQGQAYADRQADEAQQARSVHAQIMEDATRLEQFGNAGLDKTAENLRSDAAEVMYQFENFRDPEMRAAALAQLHALGERANTEHDNFVDAGLAEARTFAREELKDLRRSINEVQGGVSERKANESALAEQLALIASGEIEADSPEGQSILREAAGHTARYVSGIGRVGGAAAQALNGVPVLAGIASAGAAWLENSAQKLEYEPVAKMYLAGSRALDEFTFGNDEQPGFLSQLERSLAGREEFARDRLGIPIDESWRNTRFTYPEPAGLPSRAGQSDRQPPARSPFRMYPEQPQ